MFVKLLDENGKAHLILNIDCISSLDIYTGQYKITMVNGEKYLITEQQYDELCNILTKWL